MGKKNVAKVEEPKGKSVKMHFEKDMYYTDQDHPLYEAGKVYEIDPSMIARWLKRGGQIVEDESKVEDIPSKQEMDDEAKELSPSSETVVVGEHETSEDGAKSEAPKTESKKKR